MAGPRIVTGLAATMAVVQADNENDHNGVLLHVTITNITMGESLTPFLVVSHQDEDHLLFTPGAMANDELCISIPGPVFGWEGASPGVSGEGYVHIHPGIHGIGDLIPAERDWRNLVASIMIQRAQ